MGVGSQDAIKQFQAFIDQGLSLSLPFSVFVFSLSLSHFLIFVACFESATMVVEEPLRTTFQVSILHFHWSLSLTQLLLSLSFIWLLWSIMYGTGWVGFRAAQSETFNGFFILLLNLGFYWLPTSTVAGYLTRNVSQMRSDDFNSLSRILSTI